ncbi:LOW QUALITY PROTEIN: hypothetical protein HZS_3660 [Henneguya salminicola]|nr:LOW QUALITY PROTEIN: hypothetical protein HZS_3660 [Henneguya salminicola]
MQKNKKTEVTKVAKFGFLSYNEGIYPYCFLLFEIVDGSIVSRDGWRAYSRIGFEDDSPLHEFVNHSENFVYKLRSYSENQSAVADI